MQRWRRLVVNQQEGVSYGFWLGSVLLALLISMAVIWSVWRSRQQLAQEARERHKVEQALALESKFRESLPGAPRPVFLRNDKGEVIKRNKRAKRMEARYAADLVLPAPSCRAPKGSWRCTSRSTPMPRSPLRLGPQAPAGILSPSPTSAPARAYPPAASGRAAPARPHQYGARCGAAIHPAGGSHHPGGVCEPGQSRAAGAGEPADPGQSQRTLTASPTRTGARCEPPCWPCCKPGDLSPICCAISTPPREPAGCNFPAGAPSGRGVADLRGGAGCDGQGWSRSTPAASHEQAQQAVLAKGASWPP